MKPNVLVLRPEPQNKQCRKVLLEAGYQPIGQPLISFEAGHELKLLPTLLPSYQNINQAIIALSPRAVEYANTHLELNHKSWPLAANYFAVGRATHEAFRRCGIESDIAPTQDSEGLFALLEDTGVDLESVLILRAQDGRENLGEWLRARHTAVRYLCCYLRVSCEIEPQTIEIWPRQINAVLATSGQITKQLCQLSSNVSYQNWRQHCPIVVPSLRVAELAQTLGYYRVVVSDGASDEAMLQALQSLPLLSRKQDER
ncbi:uroporphyrinogen-III synthase [Alginatibacterium sediminis]|uniref:Uroporphyrinogen-III synthase n=1 Tax=Alginatibacterium sediminis TaxID=2164068 RepID=A0A420EN49_9ALTE|nr:uroporphyrinogen-III synthase [Alginatibacterium sediminis]RKF22110.1 uroporphyrinogen-III synthase [Alginatibacterium sediminis]